MNFKYKEQTHTNKTMTATITIQGVDNVINMAEILTNLAKVITEQDVDSYELMDGSYQIDEANLEIETPN